MADLDLDDVWPKDAADAIAATVREIERAVSITKQPGHRLEDVDAALKQAESYLGSARTWIGSGITHGEPLL